MVRTRELRVWLGQTPVAFLSAPRIGRVSCIYSQDALDRYPLGSPVLSCSLPVRPGRQDAWPFVTGLLPEGQHRSAMAQQAKVTTSDLLGMLARFGRDVAGALVVTPIDAVSPTRPDTPLPGLEALDENDLVAEVARLPEHPLGLHDDSELSIAGLQDKLLLVRTATGWARPRYGYPSTHILKVDDRVHRGLVRAEQACLELARSAGLAAASSELLRIGDVDCLAVERFDRTATNGTISRLHQEDACQALGVDPEQRERRAKYEQYGGPSLRQVAALLEAWAPDPEDELLRLLARVTFTVVIGDADAHGKNLSLLHPEPSAVTLAPLYDTVPTALWPTLRRDSAMSINAGFDLAQVTRADLVEEARRWGLSRSLIARRIEETLQALSSAVRSEAVAAVPGLEELVVGNVERLG
ncbi:MAG: serine/threonine-protein kinase HipA [Frankiaceae bacterium]|nr:serine/threonine-protein kinase HipA [Frankiaceae bacterium]